MSKIYDITQINKLFREELKKKLPQYSFSIRGEKYSGGQSQRIEITKGPKELLIEKKSTEISRGSDNLTDEGKRVQKILSEIDSKFNWNKSDPMTDYFDVNYYKYWYIEPTYEVVQSSKPSSSSSSGRDITQYLGEKLFDESGWSFWRSEKNGKPVYNLLKSAEVKNNKDQWEEIQSRIKVETGFSYFGGFKTFSKFGKIEDERARFDSLISILKDYYELPNQNTNTVPAYKLNNDLPVSDYFRITINSCVGNPDLNEYWFPITFTSIKQFEIFIADNLRNVEDSFNLTFTCLFLVDSSTNRKKQFNFRYDKKANEVNSLFRQVLFQTISQYKQGYLGVDVEVFSVCNLKNLLQYFEADLNDLRYYLYAAWEKFNFEKDFYQLIQSFKDTELDCLKEAIPLIEDFETDEYPANPFISNLTLLSAEGPNVFTDYLPQTFTSFKQCNAFIQSWLREKFEGYYKYFFNIQFNNGFQTTNKKIDIQQKGADNPESIDFVNNVVMCDIFVMLMYYVLSDKDLSEILEFTKGISLQDVELNKDEIKKIINYMISVSNYKPERYPEFPTEEERLNFLMQVPFIKTLYSSAPSKERILAQIKALELLDSDKAKKQISALKILLS